MRNANPRSVVALAAVLVIAAGCASGHRMNTRFHEAVGTAPPNDVVDRVERVIRRTGFEIARKDVGPNSTFWESRWRGRTPFDDEYDAGINEARTRLVISTRAARRTAGVVDLFRVYVTLENEVKTVGSPAWQLLETTPEFDAWARGIAAEFEEALRTGIRSR